MLADSFKGEMTRLVATLAAISEVPLLAFKKIKVTDLRDHGAHGISHGGAAGGGNWRMKAGVIAAVLHEPPSGTER